MENVINFDLLKEYDGTLKEVLKVWRKQKSYSIDDTIQYKGNYLKCITAGTSGTTTLNFTGLDVGDTITDGTVIWEIIEPPSGGGIDLPEWQSNTSYTAGKYLVYDGTVYKVVNNFTSGTTFSDTDLDAYIAPIMQGATSSADGEAGMAPKPTTTDVNKFLRGDGTWSDVGGGIAEYTTGTSYSSGDLVIKDNVLYKANTTTSTTWVDSEWDIIGTTFNTTSTYAQKIVTNVVAPYEMLLQVGDSNFCKPPIDVLKKTGGSDNVTLTLEDYNNPSAYTGTSDFLKVENSKVKLYNYKEYPITSQTLSTIDIGVSDEVDFDEFYGSSGGIDNNTLALLHFDDNVNDEVGNTWLSSITLTYGQGKFNKAVNSSDAYITTSTISNFFNSNFTVEWWWKLPSSGNPYSGLYGGSIVAGDTGGSCLIVASGSNIVIGKQQVANLVSLSYTVSNYQDNNFHHFAVVKNSNIYILFVDGILINSASDTTSFSDIGNLSIFNTLVEVSHYQFGGYVDELRISNVARWTSDFTPPTEPYTRSNYNISSLEVN